MRHVSSFARIISVFASSSQVNRHVRRNAEDAVLGGQIPEVNDIAFSNAALVFLLESQQGYNGVISSGFDFNGIHFVLGLAVVGDQEVDLNIIAFLFSVVVGIEEQPVPISGQHLRNHILVVLQYAILE